MPFAIGQGSIGVEPEGGDEGEDVDEAAEDGMLVLVELGKLDDDEELELKLLPEDDVEDDAALLLVEVEELDVDEGIELLVLREDGVKEDEVLLFFEV